MVWCERCGCLTVRLREHSSTSSEHGRELTAHTRQHAAAGSSWRLQTSRHSNAPPLFPLPSCLHMCALRAGPIASVVRVEWWLHEQAGLVSQAVFLFAMCWLMGLCTWQKLAAFCAVRRQLRRNPLARVRLLPCDCSAHILKPAAAAQL